jgi:hypothetical protein
VVFALDVTGSMGTVPEHLARTALPGFMQQLMEAGVADPQVLFMAVGDASHDRAPLQVGQFESAAREIDQWLTWSYLEGGGGDVGFESYELAMYFAARHIATDCWEKRHHRAYFFMTGDEAPYPFVSRRQVSDIVGDVLDDDLHVARVVDELSRTFEPFFLVPDVARAVRCERAWRDLLGDHVIVMESPDDTCLVAAGVIALLEKSVPDLDALAKCLHDRGTDRKRVGAVVRALTSFAAVHNLDGTPAPRLDDAPLPAGDAPGQRRRIP